MITQHRKEVKNKSQGDNIENIWIIGEKWKREKLSGDKSLQGERHR
jgi:hypothetical protein